MKNAFLRKTIVCSLYLFLLVANNALSFSQSTNPPPPGPGTNTGNGDLESTEAFVNSPWLVMLLVLAGMWFAYARMQKASEK